MLEVETPGDKHYISHRDLKQILANVSRSRRDGATFDIPGAIDDFRRVAQDDVSKIETCLGTQNIQLMNTLSKLKESMVNLGIGKGAPLENFLTTLRLVVNGNCPTLQSYVGDAFCTSWVKLTISLTSLSDAYVEACSEFKNYSNYLDINIAGFRKIIKQFSKQLPEYVYSTPLPDYAHLASFIIEPFNVLILLRAELSDAIFNLTSSNPVLPDVKLPSETLDALKGLIQDGVVCEDSKIRSIKLRSSTDHTRINPQANFP